MKKISKLLALLLALAMILSMAACQKNDKDSGKKNKDTATATETNKETDPATDEATEPVATTPAVQVSDAEALIGTWVYRADLSSALSAVLAQSLGDDSIAPEAPMYMELAFTFEQDGTGAMAAKIDQDSFNAYMESLIDLLVEFTYAAAEAEGQSRADLDAAIQAQAGMGLKDYLTAVMQASMEASVSEMESTTELQYIVDADNGAIYFTEEKTDGMNYTLDGNTLTVSDIFGDDISEAKASLESVGLNLPWTFTKK